MPDDPTTVEPSTSQQLGLEPVIHGRTFRIQNHPEFPTAYIHMKGPYDYDIVNNADDATYFERRDDTFNFRNKIVYPKLDHFWEEYLFSNWYVFDTYIKECLNRP